MSGDFDPTLPLAAQMNLDGWVVACDECGRQQHFDHVGRERAMRSAGQAGWGEGIAQGVVVKTILLCPGCRKEFER